MICPKCGKLKVAISAVELMVVNQDWAKVAYNLIALRESCGLPSSEFDRQLRKMAGRWLMGEAKP